MGRLRRVVTVFNQTPACSVKKSVEYMKLLFISLESPLAALERVIFDMVVS